MTTASPLRDAARCVAPIRRPLRDRRGVVRLRARALPRDDQQDGVTRRRISKERHYYWHSQ